MTPKDVVEAMVKSGLRGRGGAGFPTGLKWGTVAKIARRAEIRRLQRATKAIPARSWTAACWKATRTACSKAWPSPAYAVGANQGFIYVRAEYPLAITRLQIAIKQAKQLGLLGSGIFESPFNFNIDIRIGAGAFVCGEETALMASVEGKRGTPRPRPPFPAESGLWGCPTLINNVETFANVAADHPQGRGLVRRHRHGKEQGHQSVRAGRQDQEHRPASKCRWARRCGRSSRKWAAAPRTAARSRPCRPAAPPAAAFPPQHLDTPVDYESLGKLGSIMGSGGMIVMDDTTQHGGCGAVLHGILHGRIVRQMHSLPRRHRADAPPADKIVNRKATARDLAKLEELCDMVSNTSLCGLGQTAPNPDAEHAAVFPQRIRGTAPARSVWSARQRRGDENRTGDNVTQ